MLGEKITQYQQLAVGTYGYIATVDLTYLHARTVTSVTIMDDQAGTSFKSETNLAIEILLDYLEDSGCPDMAYGKSSDILYIFCKTSVYPFTDDIFFILFGTRVALPIISLTDNIDVKDEHFELFVNYCISEAAQIQGKQIPQLTLDNIKLLEDELNGAADKITNQDITNWNQAYLKSHLHVNKHVLDTFQIVSSSQSNVADGTIDNQFAVWDINLNAYKPITVAEVKTLLKVQLTGNNAAMVAYGLTLGANDKGVDWWNTDYNTKFFWNGTTWV